MGQGSHWPAPSALHCNRCLPAALSAGQSAGKGCQVGTAHVLARCLCMPINRRLRSQPGKPMSAGAHKAAMPQGSCVLAQSMHLQRLHCSSFLPLELAPLEGSLLCTQPHTLRGKHCSRVGSPQLNSARPPCGQLPPGAAKLKAGHDAAVPGCPRQQHTDAHCSRGPPATAGWNVSARRHTAARSASFVFMAAADERLPEKRKPADCAGLETGASSNNGRWCAL